MSIEVLLVIFVGVTALAFAVQTVFVWRAMRASRVLMREISEDSRDVEADVRRLAGQLQELTKGLDSMRRSFEEIGQRTADVNRMFETRAREVDRLVGTLMDVAMRQADRIDSVVADTVGKFEQTTALIQEDIIHPIVEISSLVKGVKTGVDYLFLKNRSGSGNSESFDDDHFI